LGLNVSELPQPKEVVEILVKQITSSQEEFDNSVDAFAEAYLNDNPDVDLADYESSLSANFRMNIGIYTNIEAVFKMALSILSHPGAAVDHFKECDMRCMYITYRLD